MLHYACLWHITVSFDSYPPIILLIVDTSRCDVDGLPHYMTEIKACTKKDDQCLEDGIDAWEVVFSGDFEHG